MSIGEVVYESRVSRFAVYVSAGAGNGQFDAPTGVATDAAGNLYVADNNNSRNQKFTSSGGYLTQWGGQLFIPTGVAVDAAGNVYVADYGYDRILKFTSSGSYITQWGTHGTGNGQFNGPDGVAVDAAGHVYVADYRNNRIQMFGPVTTPAKATSWGRLKSMYR